MASFKNIHKSLDRCFKKSKIIEIDSKDLRWIIFSDHHRGRKDGADDFLICEDTYLSALQHYLNDDFELCLLGDVEEFWENSFSSVMVKYLDVLELEKRFYDQERLYRIYGNHDDAWKFADTIRKYMGWLFPQISVYESLILKIKTKFKAGEMLLVHGHQGSMESDRFSGISKWFVKYIWRNIQRVFKVPLSTPSNNLTLKSAHDEAMYKWASTNDKIIICGHTHHPVFMSLTHEERILKEIDSLRKDIQNEETKKKMKALMSRVENYLDQNAEKNLDEDKKPCYFNSGCCSFSDGDITGIELADGELRLIKWSKKTNKRVLLEKISIDDIL